MKYQEQNCILKRWFSVNVCTCRTDVQWCADILVTQHSLKRLRFWDDSRRLHTLSWDLVLWLRNT